MKLAEALIERAEILKINGRLTSRIRNNAQVQEGDEPAENPEELIAEYDANMDRFLTLVQRINETNCKTPFNDKISIADAIARRDYLGAKIKAYREYYDSAVIRIERYGRVEIKSVSCLDAKKLQGHINELSKEYRETDTKLQGLNWTTDLIEK
jgi:hypothetical protein